MRSDLRFLSLKFLSFSGLGAPLMGPSTRGGLVEFCGLESRSLPCRIVSFGGDEAETRHVQIPWSWVEAASADLVAFCLGELDLRPTYNPTRDGWKSNLLSISVVAGAKYIENHFEWMWNLGSEWDGEDAGLFVRLLIWLERIQALESKVLNTEGDLDGTQDVIEPPEAHRNLSPTEEARGDPLHDLEIGGMAEHQELPFVVGVLADLTADRTPRPPLAARNFHRVAADISVDELLDHFSPQLHLKLPEGRVELVFKSLDDFSRSRIFRRLSEARDGEAKEASQRLLGSILQHPRFRRLESTWRSIEFLTQRVSAGPMLWIELLDARKEELLDDFSWAAVADRAILFRKLNKERMAPGGVPFGLVVTGWGFSSSSDDARLLTYLAEVAARSHTPFLTGATPAFFGLKSFQEADSLRRVLATAEATEPTTWSRLRDSENSRWIALALPRFLLRDGGPDGSEESSSPGPETFEAPETDSSLWGSPAFPLAVCITRSFECHGWPNHIEGIENGGLVEACVSQSLVNRVKGCVEMAVWGYQEYRLARSGFAVLCHHSSDSAVFYAVPSFQQPLLYDDETATQISHLRSRLPFVLYESRFAQSMKWFLLSCPPPPASTGQRRQALQEWVERYVLPTHDAVSAHRKLRDLLPDRGRRPSLSGAARRAHDRHPLSAARIDLVEDQGRPGRNLFVAHLRLRPWMRQQHRDVPFRVILDLTDF